jgi:hypothetical protein
MIIGAGCTPVRGDFMYSPSASLTFDKASISSAQRLSAGRASLIHVFKYSVFLILLFMYSLFMYSSILYFPFLIPYFVFLIPYFHGCTLPGTAPPQYAGNKGQGYFAGDARAKVFACAGVPVPAACEGFAGKAGYGTAEIQNRHFYTRMLLAWARRVQILCGAQNEDGVVDGEDWEEPGA